MENRKMNFNQNGALIDGVKLKKHELLEVLKRNSEKHLDDIAEALTLRRDEMHEYFTNQINKMDRDDEYEPKENINFPKPVDSSDDYSKAIRMVEMTQDDIIELNENQFDKLVMDNWDWKQSLITTSAIYGKAI